MVFTLRILGIQFFLRQARGTAAGRRAGAARDGSLPGKAEALGGRAKWAADAFEDARSLVVSKWNQEEELKGPIPRLALHTSPFGKCL